MSMNHVHAYYSQRSDEGVRSPEIGVEDSSRASGRAAREQSPQPLLFLD